VSGGHQDVLEEPVGPLLVIGAVAAPKLAWAPPHRGLDSKRKTRDLSQSRGCPTRQACVHGEAADRATRGKPEELAPAPIPVGAYVFGRRTAEFREVVSAMVRESLF
jgi:hypothetical protein